MSDLRRIAQLKEDLAQLQRKMERARGSQERVERELREELGGDCEEDWEAALRELEAEEEKVSAERDAAEWEFREKWGDLLEEGG